MSQNLATASCAVGLFIGMVLLLELGRRLGRRRQSKDAESGRAGLGAVEGAVFALMGLLVAFTFSAAAIRFDARRTYIVEEANAIGTAWLRVDLLPAASQPELRDLFRKYLDARIAMYEKIPDLEAARAEMAAASALQGEIWSRAVAASKESPTPVTAHLIPALNDMFDIASTRMAAVQIHQPTIVFIMLGVLALMSSLLAGYAMAGGKSRSWIHIFGFALILSATVYLILDLEFPRFGMIRIDAMDQLLIELRKGMK